MVMLLPGGVDDRTGLIQNLVFLVLEHEPHRLYQGRGIPYSRLELTAHNIYEYEGREGVIVSDLSQTPLGYERYIGPTKHCIKPRIPRTPV